MVRCTVTLDTYFAQFRNRVYRTATGVYSNAVEFYIHRPYVYKCKQTTHGKISG